MLGDKLAGIVDGNQGGGGVARMEARDGELLYEGAWGTLTHESRDEPVTPSTPFEIASITKMFTSTAVLLLINCSRLASLSQPVSAAAPRLLLPPHWHNVTLQQLLQHTSGIDDYWRDPAFMRAFEADEQRLWQPMDMLDYATRMPPTRGNEYHYSDTNYVLAGMVIEEAAGMSLGDYFREAIFSPLGRYSLFASLGYLHTHIQTLLHHQSTNPIWTHRHEQHRLQ